MSDLLIRNDRELVFGGHWEHCRLIPRCYHILNNTASVSHSAGAWAEVTFDHCDRLQWFATSNQCEQLQWQCFEHDGDARGQAEVWLDGVLTELVDASRLSENETCPVYDSGPLAPGRHTLRLVACSDAPIEINYIQALGNGSATRTLDCRNAAFFHYTCGFSLLEAESGPWMVSQESGDEAEAFFLGKTLQIFGKKAPSGGRFRVLLDGKEQAVVNCQDETEEHAALLFAQADLPDEGRFHHLTLQVLGDGPVGLHHLVVDEGPCMVTEMNRLVTEELEAMKTAPTFTDPSLWKPVALPGRAPQTGVTLHKGVYRTAFEQNIQYLKDSFQKPRYIDGDPYEFNIWVDILTASNEGRLLVGMGQTLRWQEVPEFRTAIKQILNDVRRRQTASDGRYLMPYDSCNYRSWEHAPWPLTSKGEQKNYDRVMFTKGMLAVGAAGFPEAYTMIRDFYDWFNEAGQYLPNAVSDSMGIQGSVGGPLMYHSPVGKPEDLLTNMKYYDLDWWMEYLSQELPEAVFRFPLNRPHNYLLTSVCAFFDQYLATGQEKYLRACYGTWNLYRRYFQNVGGSITVCEHFECPPRTHLISNLPNNILETCGNVFWIDLNQRLHLLEPEKEIYAAQIEQSLYSILFACQDEVGRIRYFNHMDARKYPPLNSNTCCEIQATKMFGELPQYLYMLTDDGVYLNQFAASELAFRVEDRPFRLTCATRFPFKDRVNLTVSAPEGGRMKLRLRMPSWLTEATEVRLNGEAAATGQPGTYVTLDREWADGDTVSYRMPMTLKASRYVGKNRVPGFSRYGIEYGPILMALQGPLNQSCSSDEPMQSAAQTPNPKEAGADEELTIRLAMKAEEFLSRLEPMGELTFRVRGEDAYTLVPYWPINEETYSCFPVFSEE